MANFFMAGADLVRWNVESLGNAGPYRLSIHHGRGTIVEYFTSAAAALEREQEIEALFLASRPPVVEYAC